MATHQYYQPSMAMNVPSKAPVAPGLYPVGRVAVPSTDFSDSSTTAGSRTTSYSANASSYAGSIGGDYESSTMSGVDVVDMLNDRVHDSFDPMPLDRGLATQAQT
jgi:biogenesis of lysosome-related organelles complex 1 subunit KXD1